MPYGMSDANAQGLLDMAAAQNNGFYDLAPDAPRSTSSTSFPSVCEEALKPAVLPDRTGWRRRL